MQRHEPNMERQGSRFSFQRQSMASKKQHRQQLAKKLLSHLFLEDYLQRDIITQQAIGPLVQVLGSGIPSLQQK